MVKSNTAFGYVIGVQKGGTGATPTFGATEYHAGDTVFLAGKYDFRVSPNVVSLWINPSVSTFGADTEPAGFISATTGTDGFTIDRFNIRQNTAQSVPAAMQWDELRVARTWAEVTPPPAPALLNLKLFPDGAFQFAYSNNSGRSYTVHASTEFTDWSPIAVATQVSAGLFQFTDTATSNFPNRFYQLRSP